MLFLESTPDDSNACTVAGCDGESVTGPEETVNGHLVRLQVCAPHLREIRGRTRGSRTPLRRRPKREDTTGSLRRPERPT